MTTIANITRIPLKLLVVIASMSILSLTVDLEEIRGNKTGKEFEQCQDK